MAWIKGKRCMICGKRLEKLRLCTCERWEQDYPSGEHKKLIDAKIEWFSCPHCGALITDSEEMAKALLSIEE